MAVAYLSATRSPGSVHHSAGRNSVNLQSMSRKVEEKLIVLSRITKELLDGEFYVLLFSIHHCDDIRGIVQSPLFVA